MTWEVSKSDAYGALEYSHEAQDGFLDAAKIEQGQLMLVSNDVYFNVPLYVIGELTNAHHARTTSKRLRDAAEQGEDK